ncbi:MAG: hypothetical protein DSM106950_07930 [Stigonema ocellatum SAG 48.90 = DSM 106950]|nr:hypothetical protein [Stigonema ocellatum SAG 48.90 = DSM 106950]
MKLLLVRHFQEINFQPSNSDLSEWFKPTNTRRFSIFLDLPYQKSLVIGKWSLVGEQ